MSPEPRYRSVRGPNPDLTRREVEIMGLVARAFSDKAIAEELCISVYTARNHIKHVYAKLKVHSRLEAIVAWRRITNDVPDVPPGEVHVKVHHAGLTWEGPIPLAPPPEC